IPADIINQLLDAAIRAPSPHNRQPWRFAVITGDARVALARAMGDQLRQSLMLDNVPSANIEVDVARSYQRVTTAPASILACLTMKDMDHYPDDTRNLLEHAMAVQAVAAAIENMLLRATELEIGACWMCAPLFCQDIVKLILGLPDDWEPQALITLGYPLDKGKDRKRFERSEVSLSISDVTKLSSQGLT
ncbi:MAG TPA: nitroreductase family protein, partial [Anaerolineae bacterium]